MGYILIFFNILFPQLLFPIVSYSYYFSRDKKYKLSMIYSLSIMAASYTRLDNTGDVTRYKQSFVYYFNRISTYKELFSTIEGKFYYFWGILNFYINKINLDFKYVTFISFILYYYSMFSIIELCSNKEKKNRKKLVVKFFMITCFITLFASYKNAVCYTLVTYGIYKLLYRKRIGIILIVLGLGFHASGIIIVLIYYLSRYIKIKNTTTYILVLIMTVLLKMNIYKAIKIISHLSLFYSKKLEYYMLGEWSNYNFSISEILNYYPMIIYLIILFLGRNALKYDTRTNRRYSNFYSLYLMMIIIFLPYRTIAMRLIIFGFPIYIYYFNLYLKKYSRKIIQMMIWYLLFDLRNLTIFLNKSYTFIKIDVILEIEKIITNILK